MKSTLATVVAIAAGLLVLGGILLQPLLDGILTILLHLAIILVGVAILIGIVNLLSIHWMRVRLKEKKSVYSFVVIAAFLITLLAGILIGPNTREFDRVVTGIQYPIEASLMSLVAVSLAFSSLTLISRKKRSLFVYLFMIGALFFILLQLGLFDNVSSPILGIVVGFLESVPIGSVRGLLIGMAMGSLITGIRILTGADRPYAG
ncbi:MAG: hypothetical protein WBV22_08040 [Anaerolineaceae bacterium]